MKVNILKGSLKTSLMCGVAVSGLSMTNAIGQQAAEDTFKPMYDTVTVTARKKMNQALKFR